MQIPHLIDNLLVLKVLKSSWDLILIFLIKDNLEGASIVIDFELNPHGLFGSVDDSAHNNDLNTILNDSFIVLLH